MLLTAGEVFHGIKLLHHCGGGAYGEVYYGEDISGKRLAVKIVSKGKLGDAWQRELKGVINYRKITENAPELLQIFHVEEDADTFFYTMEAADPATDEVYTPDTLAGRLQAGPLPQAEMFRILSAIFAGIKCIHDAGFAHRDIKPDNILFVKGVPKLGDIGLLSSLDATLTQLAGTMDFLPPELRTADGDDLSRNLSHPRNDLYAFGKVVYCAVTGNGPHEWPTVPVAQKLSLPLKFFLRFSFQLCAKDPLKRLDDVGKAERELKEIERKLLYGETLRDKITYASRQAALVLWSDVRHAGRWTLHHWLIVTLFIFAAGAATWYWWPEEPFDIAKQTSKVYRNAQIGATMNVPMDWEIMTSATIQKLVQEIVDNDETKSPLEKRRQDFFVMAAQGGGELLFCDYDEKFKDNIVFHLAPDSPETFMKMSDDEMRLEIQTLFQGALRYKTKIYEVKHREIAHFPGLFIDYSYEKDGNVLRVNSCFLFVDNRSINIVLTCKEATYQQRKAEFTSVLSTLKFDQKR